MSRLAVIRFEGETHATGTDAAVPVESPGRWIGTQGQPSGLLGDGAGGAVWMPNAERFGEPSCAGITMP